MEEKQPFITKELLDERWEHAQKLHDDLNDEYHIEMQQGGRLTSARLCEKSAEYENYVLETQMLEKLLKENENGGDM